MEEAEEELDAKAMAGFRNPKSPWLLYYFTSFFFACSSPPAFLTQFCRVLQVVQVGVVQVGGCSGWGLFRLEVVVSIIWLKIKYVMYCTDVGLFDCLACIQH
jgi:hypothetical protein